jgi:hypothetical protein
MTAGFKVKSGSKSLDKMFANLEALCSEENFKAMIYQAGQIALEEARRLCPVDSGIMKKAINVRYDGFSFILYCTAPYWLYQEYGFRNLPVGAIGSEDNPRFYKGGYRPFMRAGMHKAAKFMEEFVQNVQEAKVAFNIAAKNTTWDAWMLL